MTKSTIQYLTIQFKIQFINYYSFFLFGKFFHSHINQLQNQSQNILKPTINPLLKYQDIISHFNLHF